MKIFFDDFIVFNHMNIHLEKLQLCYFYFQEFDISLNPKKCVFIILSRLILEIIISWEGNLPNPKKF